MLARLRMSEKKRSTATERRPMDIAAPKDLSESAQHGLTTPQEQTYVWSVLGRAFTFRYHTGISGG